MTTWVVGFRRLKRNVVFRMLLNYDSEGDVMATATQSALMEELDTKKRSSTSRHFEDALRQKIVGQDEAVQALVELYQVFCAGFMLLVVQSETYCFWGRPVQARRALSRPLQRFCSEIAER